jgi:hypothetical protein
MNPMKMLWITLVLCCQFCFAQSRDSKVAPSGETTISTVLGKTGCGLSCELGSRG